MAAGSASDLTRGFRNQPRPASDGAAQAAHTAKRIFDRLREEQQAEVSYSRVRVWRCAAGRSWPNLVVPTSKCLCRSRIGSGEEAEVDFGDVVVEL